MFASDGVSIIGGVDPIVVGAPSNINTNAQIGGTQPASYPLEAHALLPLGTLRPMTQIPVAKSGPQRAREDQPGIGTLFGKVAQWFYATFASPEPTRGDNIPTPFERRAILTGQWNDHPDMERRGLNFEPAGGWLAARGGVVNGSQPVNYIGDWGLVNDVYGNGSNTGPAQVINTPPDGTTDDQCVQTQDIFTNENDLLKAYRSSWPASSVNQSPVVTRSIVLQQIGGSGNFVGELNVPSGAVTARIMWTNSMMNDLWVSWGSAAVVPVGSVQPGTGGPNPTQSSPLNDGVVLNPDPTTRYLIQGKLAISFAASSATTVNVHFYMQA